uniref:Putative nuclease HARBI1 n=1 Tax=Meloidogyne javanica TaxID=6303 RepID=A0A915N2E7_MELJA
MAEFMDLQSNDDAPIRRREKGLYSDPIEYLRRLSSIERDNELIKTYRFHEEGINYLCSLVEDKLKPLHGNKGNPVPIHLQYLASNTLQLHIGQHFNISQKTISKIILRVTKAFADVAHKHIHLLDKNESSKVKREFLNYCGLPMIVGCIDCTHIRIRAPVSDEKSYVNRKGWHSLNVQAVCDNNCKFENVVIEWPGSVHDSFILRQSNLWNHFEKRCVDSNDVILGDSGYPLRTWLFVPYSNPKTEGQKRFNYALSKGRTRIEHSFGQLKRRFRMCYSICELDTERIPDAILSCFLLHNIAIEMRLPEIEENIDDQQPPIREYEEIDKELPSRSQTEAAKKREAAQRRDTIASRFDY